LVVPWCYRGFCSPQGTHKSLGAPVLCESGGLETLVTRRKVCRVSVFEGFASFEVFEGVESLLGFKTLKTLLQNRPAQALRFCNRVRSDGPLLILSLFSFLIWIGKCLLEGVN